MCSLWFKFKLKSKFPISNWSWIWFRKFCVISDNKISKKLIKSFNNTILYNTDCHITLWLTTNMNYVYLQQIPEQCHQNLCYLRIWNKSNFHLKGPIVPSWQIMLHLKGYTWERTRQSYWLYFVYCQMMFDKQTKNYPIIIVRHIVIGTVTACVSPIISSSISSSISSDDALPLSVTPLSLYNNYNT